MSDRETGNIHVVLHSVGQGVEFSREVEKLGFSISSLRGVEAVVRVPYSDGTGEPEALKIRGLHSVKVAIPEWRLFEQ